MLKRLSVILVLSIVITGTFGINSADAVVNVYNAKNDFVGELISVQKPGEWVVYNPELDRLLLMNSLYGWIQPLDWYPCPFFEPSSCSGDPYLQAYLMGWITVCNDRIFKAVGTEIISLDAPSDILQQSGACGYHPEKEHVVTAEELSSSEIPFDIGLDAGPLRTEYTPSGGGNGVLPTVQEVPAPAITPQGILLLATLLGGFGYLAIRRKK